MSSKVSGERGESARSDDDRRRFSPSELSERQRRSPAGGASSSKRRRRGRSPRKLSRSARSRSRSHGSNYSSRSDSVESRRRDSRRGRKKSGGRRRRSRSSSASASSGSHTEKKSKKRKRSKEARRHKKGKDKRRSSSRQRVKNDDTQAVSLNASERKKLKKENKLAAFMGYTNESNPFGDSQLHKPFYWEKKVKKEMSEQRRKSAPSKRELREHRDSRLKEIEEVKRRRELREKEREEMERLRAEEERLREQEMYGDFVRQEEEFHARQQRYRSAIRIREGREKPIDILAKNVLLWDASERGDMTELEDEETWMADPALDVELDEPYGIFEGLLLGELEELQEDIAQFVKADGDGPYGQYWKALADIADDETRRARAKELGTGMTGVGSVPEAVEPDVCEMLEGKSVEELDEMAATIQQQLKGSGSAGSSLVAGGQHRRGFVSAPHNAAAPAGASAQTGGASTELLEGDSFWDGVLRALVVFRARAVLDMLHVSMLEKRLVQLERLKRSMEEEAGGKENLMRDVSKQEHEAEAAAGSSADRESRAISPQLVPFETAAAASSSSSTREEENGAAGQAERRDHAQILDPVDDLRQLEQQRQRLRVRYGTPSTIQPIGATPVAVSEVSASRTPAAAGGTEPTGMLVESAQQQGVGEAEDVFAQAEEVLMGDPEAYMWQDKYRPRKPRYFNRVKTGYDWNQYNSTHFDRENPPPKQVQGYKFNIFYPDLLDRTKTPSYSLEPADSPEFCIIRFHGGPPYEDIAFKIVNRDWEFARKRGFRCSFDRGVLHLWFNFKRLRYRR